MNQKLYRFNIGYNSYLTADTDIFEDRTLNRPKPSRKLMVTLNVLGALAIVTPLVFLIGDHPFPESWSTSMLLSFWFSLALPVIVAYTYLGRLAYNYRSVPLPLAQRVERLVAEGAIVPADEGFYWYSFWALYGKMSSKDRDSAAELFMDLARAMRHYEQVRTAWHGFDRLFGDYESELSSLKSKEAQFALDETKKSRAQYEEAEAAVFKLFYDIEFYHKSKIAKQRAEQLAMKEDELKV